MRKLTIQSRHAVMRIDPVVAKSVASIDICLSYSRRLDQERISVESHAHSINTMELELLWDY